MSSSIFRIPAAAAAAVFLLSAFQPVSADIYTDEHVIEQTKEDIVKLKKLLPSKAANGVTLVDVIYTEPEKGASGNGTITYVQRFDSIRKKDIPDLEKFGRDVQDSMWHISEQICENEGTRMRIDHGIELRYKYVGQKAVEFRAQVKERALRLCRFHQGSRLLSTSSPAWGTSGG